MTKQDYESELRIQPTLINNVNELSIASTYGIDNQTLNRQKLQLQMKDGAARLGLSIGGMN